MGVSRKLAETARPRVTKLPPIDHESYLEFVLGFPCVWTRCPGRLVAAEYDTEGAVVCSECDSAYYRIDC